MNKFRIYLLYGILFISGLFLIIYIFSDCFRNFLFKSNIDPNFLVAFVSMIGLLVSIISIRKERKFNFDLYLKNSIEEKVSRVVGKLFTVMNNAEIYYGTILRVKNAMDESKKFVDGNNVLNLNEELSKDRDSLGACLTIYFPGYITSEDWNSLNEKMSILATNCSNVLINYNENFSLIGTPGFHNQVLSNIDVILEDSKNLNKEIHHLTEKIKDLLLDIVSKNDKKIRDNYIN